MKIYHNNRCRKSREALHILQEAQAEIEIIDYLNQPPTVEQIGDLLSKLNIQPIELIRKSEAIWKEKFKGQTLTDHELIKIMHENPKLIERPIVIKGNKAIIGRPPELIKEFL